jgi:hypothetical protein
MNTRASAYIQAIRGPVVPVTIGVLFAIHQAGVLSFARTWPLLIIVIGVMKLLERVGAPAQPWADPGRGTPYASPASAGQRRSGQGIPPRDAGGSNA